MDILPSLAKNINVALIVVGYNHLLKSIIGASMLKKVLSMKVAIVLLFIFGLVIGVATFIENDYGTETARSLVYSARWFEVFLLFFTVVLIYNGYRYKSYKRAKWSIFLFHFSFVMVAVGAGLTRYVGYEGIMHIREGESTNKMVSDVKVLRIEA